MHEGQEPLQFSQNTTSTLNIPYLYSTGDHTSSVVPSGILNNLSIVIYRCMFQQIACF